MKVGEGDLTSLQSNIALKLWHILQNMVVRGKQIRGIEQQIRKVSNGVRQTGSEKNSLFYSTNCSALLLYKGKWDENKENKEKQTKNGKKTKNYPHLVFPVGALFEINPGILCCELNNE